MNYRDRFRGLRAIVLLLSTLSIQLFASDLDTGRVERVLRRDSLAQMSSIAYMYFVARPDMPRYQRAVNEFVSNSVGTLWQDQPDRTTAELSPAWFGRVLEDFDSVFREGMRVNPESAPWTLIDSIEITDQVVVKRRATALVQVFKRQYEFTGGAHGLSSSISMLFHRNTGEMVSFKDLMGSSIKKVTSIAESYFRKQRGIPPGQSLKKAGYWFDNGFTLPDNVRFEDDSLVLIYNQYEVAPYALGTIVIRVPIDKVLPFLRIPWSD